MRFKQYNANFYIVKIKKQGKHLVFYDINIGIMTLAKIAVPIIVTSAIPPSSLLSAIDVFVPNTCATAAIATPRATK